MTGSITECARRNVIRNNNTPDDSIMLAIDFPCRFLGAAALTAAAAGQLSDSVQ